MGARGRATPSVSRRGLVAEGRVRQLGGDYLGRGGRCLGPASAHRGAGARPPGDAALSASEQAGATATDETVLAAGNAAYEQRFGYIFLICATGLTGAQMLAELRDRLTHTDDEERPVVMDELRKIAALRLDKAVMP